MKPYYESDGIAIYHGDCREVLPALGTHSADLIVTDPPYGMNWRSNARQQRFDRIVGDADLQVAREGVEAALEYLAYRRHLYVFGGLPIWDGLRVTTTVELIWDKGEALGPGNLSLPWSKTHEAITFAVAWGTGPVTSSVSGRLAARLRRGSVIRVLRVDGKITTHPTEKPVQLLRELIESSSCFGEIVVDPFMGSGTTLRAAQLEGRQAIGIEIEERYCEIAAKRLSQGVLFGAEVA